MSGGTSEIKYSLFQALVLSSGPVPVPEEEETFLQTVRVLLCYNLLKWIRTAFQLLNFVVAEETRCDKQKSASATVSGNFIPLVRRVRLNN